MARRKRFLEDDDDSDSYEDSDAGNADFGLDEDPDAREERALFEDPYKRKRRRKNGKEDALYGVFAESDDEDRGSGRGGRNGQGGRSKRSDWTKAPAFVTGQKQTKTSEEESEEEHADPDAMNVDGEDGDSSNDENEGEEEEEGEGEGEGAEDPFDDESEPSRRPSPRIREDEEEEESTSRPRFGGIGMGMGSKGGIGSGSGSGNSVRGGMSIPFAKGGIGTSRLASSIGELPDATDTSLLQAVPSSSRGGIGSSSRTTENDDLPASFGGGSRSASFLRDTKPSRPATPLSHSEQMHFTKISGSFGARLLEKMGWKSGTGLGVSGEGIITPVESKLRPERSGIAFRGFKEKTQQSKMEARRRGEVISDDEDDPMVRKARKKEREAKEKRSNIWKKPKKVKTKIEHKTYEQIIAEAGGEPPSSGIGQIIDATGAIPKEVSSLAEVSLNNWTPSIDPTRIPEVRHNIRLISETCKSDLDGLAREAKSLEERKRFVTQEDVRLRKKVDDEAELIARLQQIQLVATEIDAKAKELASVYEVSLDHFSPLFYKLMSEYEREFEQYQLDELVVAAIAPLVRRMVAQWNPLEDPIAFMDAFRNWRRGLCVNQEKPPEMQIDRYGSATVAASPVQVEKQMTPFESLLWNVWLPRVRTAINNEWSPKTPRPVVKLYEAWSTYLPAFIRDNMLDQLILPKVQKAVSDWNPKLDEVSLHAIVFPWLPHVGLRMEEFLGEARRKVKSLLRHWAVGDPIPGDLKAWKEVFDAVEWDNILLKYIVPKLGATLRNDFRVNPRNQNMEPLQQVWSWSDLLRPSILIQILETEFFPKWLDVLHVWLIQPKVSFGEVAQWYDIWKGNFPESMRNLPGFTRGLQLMNQAMELGPDAPSRLRKPDYRSEKEAALATSTSTKAKHKVIQSSTLAHEVTFRSIVEEFAASHNLMFMPAGKAHEKSRMPLFRVSLSADGKGGVLVFILDDAVWASREGIGGPTEDYRPISLEDMALRATGKG
ncbi:TFP11-domain-containing protein [Marasmius fiardii PR-910]|nr:TFP11-domain-containing protein [Marasmius fiardii PR-910]